MASPPAARSTRSRPSLPPSLHPTSSAGLTGSSSSSSGAAAAAGPSSSTRSTPNPSSNSHGSLLPLPVGAEGGGSPQQSANALSHALYTQSLHGLTAGTRRRRTKSSGEVGNEKMAGAAAVSSVDDAAAGARSPASTRSTPAAGAGGQEIGSSSSAVAGLDATSPLTEPTPPSTSTGGGRGGTSPAPPPPAVKVEPPPRSDGPSSSTVVAGAGGASSSVPATVPAAVKPEPNVSRPPPPPTASASTSTATAAGKGMHNDNDGADEEEDQVSSSSVEEAEVTRCVCGITESDDMMIQCDTCNVWQHGNCVGIPTEEETPDEYFCEKCRPDLHVPLKKWTKARGRGGIFLPPSPADLARLRDKDDIHPPNQSKRWTHDLPGLKGRKDEAWELASEEGGAGAGGAGALGVGEPPKRGRRSRGSGGLPVLKGKAERSVSAAAAAAAAAANAANGTGGASSATIGSSSHNPTATSASTSSAADPSSVGSTKGARSTAGKPTSAASSSSHHPHGGGPSTSSAATASRSKGPAGSSAPRPPSSSRTSPSPPPDGHPSSSGAAKSSKQRAKSPIKRGRSTLNSRHADAGLEEAIRASLIEANGGVLPDHLREADEAAAKGAEAEAASGEEEEESNVGGGGDEGEGEPRLTRRRATTGRKAASARSESNAGDAPHLSAAIGGSTSAGTPILSGDAGSQSGAGGAEGGSSTVANSTAAAAVSGQKRGRSDGSGGRKGKKAKKEMLPAIMDVDAEANGLEFAGAVSAGNNVAGPSSGKVKHPNQYTYRPKAGGGGGGNPYASHGNGLNGAGPSMSSGAPGPFAHSTSPTKAKSGEGRRSGGGGGGAGSGGRSGTPSGELGGSGSSRPGASWGLPDHLSHLSSTILPTPCPIPLRVPAVVNAASSSTNEVTRGLRDEPPTRVRWPGRRMTIGEMRKRVRGILDFVGRWPPAEASVDNEGAEAAQDVSTMAATDAEVDGEDLPAAAKAAPRSTAGTSTKSRADEVEELVRDLIAFEQRFGVAALLAATTATTNGGGAASSASGPTTSIQPAASSGSSSTAAAPTSPAREGTNKSMAEATTTEDVSMEDARPAVKADTPPPPPTTTEEAVNVASVPPVTPLVGLGLDTPSSEPSANHQDDPSTAMDVDDPLAVPPTAVEASIPTKPVLLPPSIPTAGDELAAAVVGAEPEQQPLLEDDQTASLLAEGSS